MPGHAPLITEVGIGELTYKTKGGESGLLAVIRGFAEVLPDRVSVLAETAEFAADRPTSALKLLSSALRFNPAKLASEFNLPLVR